MEAYFAFAKKVVEAFDGAGLDYALTGALATSFYGTPRTTSDIDVMVAVASEADLKTKLTAALQRAGLAVNEHKIDTALSSGFKIATFKDTTSPYCIDVVFSGEKLEKRAGKIAGLGTFFQSPEGVTTNECNLIMPCLTSKPSCRSM
ncbi:MAG: hypothetical protein M1490_04235 [Candidatus Bathyarchaeota archaeon]|nr:hypothetical protein [Candidatus Bathyarchaeota archaeon]